MSTLAIAVAVICGVGLFFWHRHAEEKERERFTEMGRRWNEERLSDEGIATAQAEFEKGLVENLDLPDAVDGREAFTYWHCMAPWFSKLDPASRYDEAKFKRIRSDWLEYMSLLGSSSTLSFLSAESSDEKKRQEYWDRFDAERKKLRGIENAFAAAIGEDAIEHLEIVRSRSYDAFDRSGRKPIAPFGFHYSMASIHPYRQELVKDSVTPTRQDDLQDELQRRLAGLDPV